MERHCEKCGALLQAEDAFCPGCGAALLPIESSKTPAPMDGQPPASAPLAAASTHAEPRGGSSPETKIGQDMKKAVMRRGVGLIFVGVLLFLFARELNPVWGGALMAYGLLNLAVRHRIMLIFNGLALITAGLTTVVSIISIFRAEGTGSGYHSALFVLGFFLAGWGFAEIASYYKFSTKRSGRKAAGLPEANALIAVERKDIEHPSAAGYQALQQVLDGLARQWIADEQPGLAELSIHGYEDDPRHLYQVAEVCAWAQRAAFEIPVLPFFLTDAALDQYVTWQCGPLAPAVLAFREFEDRFAEKRSQCLSAALLESSPYLTKMGAEPAALAKFYPQSEGKSNKEQVFRKKKRVSRAVLVWKAFLAILVVAIFAALFYWLLVFLEIPGLAAALPPTPTPAASPTAPMPTLAPSALPSLSANICWSRELTDFEGNRAQLWENILDGQIRERLPLKQFSEEVVANNPQLKSDGYVFFGQKSYLIPEMCP